MCLPEMSKRVKFVLTSLSLSAVFLFVINLPYEWKYFAIWITNLWLVFVYWLALGILNNKNWQLKILLAFLPMAFWVGFCLFVILLPLNWPICLVLALIFAIINYVIFLVENIFLVAVGFRTVPLYRAAYTVTLIVVLLSSFFLFNSVFSFNLKFCVGFKLSAEIFNILRRLSSSWGPR